MTHDTHDWSSKALNDCIQRLYELGELDFDDEETGCYYWVASGKLLGIPD